MKNGALFLLIILLLSLVLCSVLGGKNCSEGYMGNGKVTKGKESFSLGNLTGVFKKKKEKFSLLGGSYDNYEHFTGSSVPTTYTGSNGSATVSYENGTYTINVTDNSGTTTVYTVNNTNTNTNTTSSNSSTSSSVEDKDDIEEIIFTSPNGGSASVYTGDNGNYLVKVYNSNTGATSIYSSTNGSGTMNSTTTNGSTSSSTTYSTTNDSISATTYYGPNGSARVVKNSSTGQYAVEVTGPNGEKVVYNSNTNTVYTNGSNSLEGTTYIGPNGTATIVKGDNGQYVVKISDNYGNVVIYDSKNNTAYTNTNTNGSSDPYYYNGNNYTSTNTNSGSASVDTVSGQYGNTAFYATGPNGNSVAGVSGSSIPSGDEDLYILKSQIVPPVCPACPSAASCPRQEPCPACPACARCPEPAFECKKVPNYNNINDNYLPMPVLSDFSTFGM
jgi:hypothetical protein